MRGRAGDDQPDCRCVLKGGASGELEDSTRLTAERVFIFYFFTMPFDLYAIPCYIADRLSRGVRQMKFRMAHNNFNVLDLEKSLAFYEEAFDYEGGSQDQC